MSLIKQKCRLCRRERTKLFLKGQRCFDKCPLERRGAVPPGEHGLKSNLRLSAFGTQLRGKQKVKRFYGVTEKQLKNYFLKAARKSGDIHHNLISLLELRLDNVVYKSGLTPSRRTARQLIGHGHLRVNDQKVTIPSYQLKEKDRLELSAKTGELALIKEWLAKKSVDLPDWLEKKGLIVQVKALPEKKDWPADLSSSLVVEYYSR